MNEPEPMRLRIETVQGKHLLVTMRHRISETESFRATIQLPEHVDRDRSLIGLQVDALKALQNSVRNLIRDLQALDDDR